MNAYKKVITVLVLALFLAASLLQAARVVQLNANDEADETPIHFTIIGYDIKSGSKEERMLQEMAKAANGRYLSVQSDQPGQLANALLQGMGVLPPGPLQKDTAKGPEEEPNNRFSEAMIITPDAKITGTIKPRGDRDRYRIHVPHQGQLDVLISKPAPNLSLWFEIYNSDYKRIAGPFYAARKGFENSGTSDLPEAGNYWLQMGDRNDRGESDSPYLLQLKFLPTVDNFEPNQSIGKAFLIQASETLQATILPRGDRDWYCLKVDHQGQLEINVKKPPEKLEIWIEVFNADARRIAGPYYPARRGMENFANVDLPDPGTYYIQLGDRSDKKRSVKPYNLETIFTPTVDRFEPNPSFGKAYAIPASGTLQAAILPRGDRDWYCLKVDHQGQLEINVKKPPEELEIWIEVFNADARRIAGLYYPARRGMENFANVDLPDPGTYYIQLGDRSDKKRSVKPYNLETIFTPTVDRFEPNPSFGKAYTIPASGTLQAAILPRGDHDWYRITVNKPGKLKLTLSSIPENLNLWIELYNNDARRIAGPYYASSKSIENITEYSLTSAGTYNIRIGTKNRASRSVKSYTLYTEFTPGSE